MCNRIDMSLTHFKQRHLHALSNPDKIRLTLDILCLSYCAIFSFDFVVKRVFVWKTMVYQVTTELVPGNWAVAVYVDLEKQLVETLK
jgi:hypothetical protein